MASGYRRSGAQTVTAPDTHKMTIKSFPIFKIANRMNVSSSFCDIYDLKSRFSLNGSLEMS